MIDNVIDSIEFGYELLTTNIETKDWVKHLVPIDNILSLVDCEVRSMYLEANYNDFCKALSTHERVLAYLEWNERKKLKDIILCEHMGIEEIFCYYCN